MNDLPETNENSEQVIQAKHEIIETDNEQSSASQENEANYVASSDGNNYNTSTDESNLLKRKRTHDGNNINSTDSTNGNHIAEEHSYCTEIIVPPMQPTERIALAPSADPHPGKKERILVPSTSHFIFYFSQTRSQKEEKPIFMSLMTLC